MQALKQGQLPSDLVLPGDDVAKKAVTNTDNGVPPSDQHVDEVTAMDEV